MTTIFDKHPYDINLPENHGWRALDALWRPPFVNRACELDEVN